MSKVSDAIKAAHALVEQPKGAFDYKKGQTWKRFKYHLNNPLLRSKVKSIIDLASVTLDAKLTPEQANILLDVIEMQEPVSSFIETEAREPLEAQYNSGFITAKIPAITSLIANAKDAIERDVVSLYRRAAIEEVDQIGRPRSRDEKIAGLIAFGMSPEEARKCQWSGKNVMDQAGHPIDLYAMAKTKP